VQPLRRGSLADLPIAGQADEAVEVLS